MSEAKKIQDAIKKVSEIESTLLDTIDTIRGVDKQTTYSCIRIESESSDPIERHAYRTMRDATSMSLVQLAAILSAFRMHRDALRKDYLRELDRQEGTSTES
jgi:hypothetical protein